MAGPVLAAPEVTLPRLERTLASRPVRLAAIDALRAVAALMVILPHAWGFFNALPKTSFLRVWLFDFTEAGTRGVDIFFVISGFVIAWTFAAQRAGKRDCSKLFLRRMIRLAPPYWVSILVMTGCLLLQAKLGNRPGEMPGVGQLIAHVFYLQEILGWKSIVVVYWTLCVEVQFYALFYVVLIVA